LVGLANPLIDRLVPLATARVDLRELYGVQAQRVAIAVDAVPRERRPRGVAKLVHAGDIGGEKREHVAMDARPPNRVARISAAKRRAGRLLHLGGVRILRAGQYEPRRWFVFNLGC
jgi:hypothetical protein